MKILCIRTDKPESELYLRVDGKVVQSVVWEAHRQLADTISRKVDELMELAGELLTDLDGVIVYEGPGSFTGLRIGMTVANTIAYSYGVPILAAGTEDWLLSEFTKAAPGEYAVPEYGGSINITKPRK